MDQKLFSKPEYEEAFWDKLPIGQALLDPKGCFTRLNPAWSRLLGYSMSELTGLSWDEITHPADIGDAKKELARVASAQNSTGVAMVIRLISKASGTVWVELHVSSIREPSGACRQLAVSAIPLPNSGNFKVEQAGDGYAVRPAVRWIDMVRDNPRETVVVVMLLLSASGAFPFEHVIHLIKSLLIP